MENHPPRNHQMAVQPQASEVKNHKIPLQQSADRVEITYYTDPLCCWSWGQEPQWRKLRYELRNKISWRYCMGGFLSDWQHFHDSVNSISRPLQMGPVWTEARHVSGMPIQDRIWMGDPPSTSYLACVAVKCAAFQSKDAEEKYLRYTREAVMLHGLNISKQNVLFDIAAKLSQGLYGFDVARFIEDFQSGAGTDAFRKDLEEVRYKDISRFPTFIISGADKRGVMIAGYRPYIVLYNAIRQIATSLLASQPIDIEDYKNYFGSLTQREIDEALVNIEIK